MMKKISGLFIEETGQGMTEYGLILGLIALAAVAALGFFGDAISAKFTEIKNKLAGTDVTPPEVTE